MLSLGTDDPGEMSVSQESLYDDMSEFDSAPSDAESFRAIGLGKGKPYASKIAKKKLSYSIALPGRPKGGGFGKGRSFFLSIKYFLRLTK